MATHQFAGITAHFTASGAGPEVVLLHAGGSSGAQRRKVSACLDGHYRLIMPDFIGFGDTGGWPGPDGPSHDDQADLLASLIAEACAGPVHMVGHSFGGAVAVCLALAKPDLLRRLILIEPVLTPLLNQAGQRDVFAEYSELAQHFIDNGRAGRGEDAWWNFIDYRNGAGTWAGLSERARARFLGGTKQIVDTYVSNLADPTTLADIRSIAIPTLVLCGENTTEPDRAVTQILHRKLPVCDYRIVPGAEHMSPLTHPDPVAAAIRAHLE